MSTNGCIRRQHAYWTTCRCENCAPDRAKKRKKHYVGYTWRVPQDVAWRKLAGLFEQGWSSSAASSACGYTTDYFGRHLAAWRRGEETLLGPAVADAIVNMGRPTTGQVGAGPTRRRLRALATIGYSLQTIATEADVNFSTLAMVRSRNERVNATIANAVADAYTRLHMLPGPDPQAAKMARGKGWLSPLAYDDIDGADPEPIEDWLAHYAEADVDPVVVMRLLEGRPIKATVAEKEAAMAQWVRDGGSRNELARIHGWKSGRYTEGLRVIHGGAA